MEKTQTITLEHYGKPSEPILIPNADRPQFPPINLNQCIKAKKLADEKFRQELSSYFRGLTFQ